MIKMISITLLILFALSVNNVHTEEKRPGVAFMLSGFLISGSGQFYNGQGGKGMIFLVSEMFSWGLMLSALEKNLDFNPDTSGTTSGKVGVGLFLGSRFISAVDASVSAQKINQQKAVSISPMGNKERELCLH